MRTFVQGQGADRRFVHIELHGRRMAVVHGKADGTSKRSEKEYASDSEASAASDLMARELATRGFVEQTISAKSKPASAAKTPASPPKKAPPKSPPLKKSSSYDEDDEPPGGEYVLHEPDEPAAPAPLLSRSGPEAPGAKAASEKADDEAPKKKKKKKRKKKEGEKKDWIFILGTVGTGSLLVGILGWFIWNAFLKPASIVGVWQGSKLEYEISESLTHEQMRLVLGANGSASLIRQGEYVSAGTYKVEGDRLKMNVKHEEDDPEEFDYKFTLSSVELALFNPEDGKQIMRLIRQSAEEPSSGGTAPPPAPTDLAAGEADAPADPAADAALASAQFIPKDTAFSIRYPQGWESKDGSRPDNTYSWGEFTKGSARIRVDADIRGSLMAGPLPTSDEEGAEHPTSFAHQENRRAVADSYEDYQESEPVPFKGSKLGEGRLSVFTAKGGGLVFAPKIKGYRLTLLTNNRRVTVLCQCPETDFNEMEPTFRAVCRSVSQ